ncbi:uncharacterized protein LOC142639771 [Castanea sativa]|uniref:uncharacterized protein LOC142639771 n=1 Tax=Castanea sativa TaxID=21020 RepID=UPI003F649D0F
MSDVFYRATKYMNAEDALLAREDYKPRKRERQEDTKPDNGRKMIEALIKQGRLQRFVKKERTDQPQEQNPRRENERPRPPVGDIRMIVGGNTSAGSSKKARKTYLRTVQRVQSTGASPIATRQDSPSIGFTEEDARRLHHPHDDALVVSIRAGDYNMHRVLVDNGNSADILYYPAFQQMGIDKE